MPTSSPPTPQPFPASDSRLEAAASAGSGAEQLAIKDFGNSMISAEGGATKQEALMLRIVKSGNAHAATLGLAVLLASSGHALADEVINQNLIVQGSACVGADCIDGEAFGTGTLRLKEGETRADFIATNTSPFPARDWRLEANANTSGGAEYFAINDMGDSASSPAPERPLR